MPKLRFPGFEGEWENTELGNLAIYGKDKTRVTKNHFVSTENIEQNFGGIVPFEDSKTMVDGTEFTKGDILIANIRPYLKKIWQSDMDGACNADVLVLKPQEIDNVFFYFLVAQNKFIDYVMGGVKGSKMPRGDKAHILQYNTAVPSILEQQQIAKFLSLLSNRIATQKELVETLKKYKRGLLDKIFPPKKDSLFPTVRLSKMADFLQGLTYSPIDIANSGYLVLRSSNIQNAALSFDDCVYVNMEIPTHLQVKQGDIIMCVRNGSKKLVGKSAKIPCEMPMTTWGAFMMIIRSKIDCSYIYQYLNSQAFYSQVFKDTGTATINQITKGILNECELPLPPKNERDRIATLLDGFDKRIESTYFSLLKMQDLRKSLLQQLFI